MCLDPRVLGCGTGEGLEVETRAWVRGGGCSHGGGGGRRGEGGGADEGARVEGRFGWGDSGARGEKVLAEVESCTMTC